jgi:DNA repair protein RecN (Recombination protein N)
VISRLCRKYGDTVEAVLQTSADAQSEIDSLENFEDNLVQAQQAVREAEVRAAEIASTLSSRRRSAADTLVDAVRERLARLGLGPGALEITLDQTPSDNGLPISDGEGHQSRLAFTQSGIDRVQLLVSFSAGEPVRPIERIASGGETARFVLAVKSAMAAMDDIPTLIFDEIDTGVGGRSASVVAEMMADLAQSHQVLSITHLPQIAAAAGQHLKVVKEESAHRTSVRVDVLAGASRRAEIAEMLSGFPPSDAAMLAASEMLEPAGANR